MSLIPETRKENFLARIAGDPGAEKLTPITREEHFLEDIVEAVAGGGEVTPGSVVSATAAMTPEQAAQTRQNIGADTPATVTAWLDAHVDPDTGYVIDDTLTIEGAAADAKATGDTVGELKSAIDIINQDVLYNQILDKTIHETTNNACTFNNDGTFTIGTGDYGNTFVGGAVYLEAGEYLLYGVPIGFSFVTESKSNYSTPLVSNSSEDPVLFVVENARNYYIGYRIGGLPSKSYTINPFLFKSAMYDAREGIGKVNQIYGVKDCLIESANLIDETTIQTGYIQKNGRAESNSAFRYFEAYIPVTPGDTIYFKPDVRFLCAYNINKAAQSSKGSDDTISSYVVPDGISYIRVSYLASNVTNGVMANTGEGILPYQPYGTFVKYTRVDGTPNIDKYENALGHTQKIVTETSISNDSITITDFPVSLKKNIAMSYYCEFSTYDTIKIGRGGSGIERCKWFEITSSQVILHGDEVEATENHLLTMSTFLSCNIFYGLDKIYFNMTTMGGSYSHEFTTDGNARGNSFATISGTATNVKLTCECCDLQKPLWLFSDSYFSTDSSARVGYYMKQMGFTDYAMFAYPGMNSETGISELNKAKVFGTPKFIVWMLGMNGSDDSAITSINSLMSYAQKNGVTVIITKIPSVPNKRNTTLNAFVESSGYRYINSYLAMGCDGTGDTYDGYLSSDNVHPTALGAKAIAMRILVDAPEVMLYGKKE